MLGDGFGNFQDMLQISTAIFIGWGAYSDKLDFRLGDGFSRVRGELQSAFSEVGFD